MSDTVAKIDARLKRARQECERLRAASEQADRRAEAVTPGGLRGYDPAVLSGVTRSRKRGAAQRERRFAAYDAQAGAGRALRAQEQRVAALERQLERARRDEVAPCDLDAVGRGWLVRDRHGWHRVVRVNAKTFSVETPYSWTDRIPRDRVIETRAPRQDSAASGDTREADA